MKISQVYLEALWFSLSFLVGFCAIMISPEIETKLLGVVIMVYAIIYSNNHCKETNETN